MFYEGVHAMDAGGMLTLKMKLAWLRTCRHTMVHESCHMLGILHCVYWHCLMNGNNGPGDSTGSTGFLCPVCLRKLMFALASLCGPESAQLIDQRYASLQMALSELANGVDEDVCAASGLRRDLEWLECR